jgi:hypothetical protein
MDDWPLIAPLPSYGRGRDEPGPRYSNFISGSNLTDVIITGTRLQYRDQVVCCCCSSLQEVLISTSNLSGRNGTIDGQGQVWWDKYRAKKLKYTRGYLLELLFSDNVLIYNVTFKDSPSWNLHPTYCTYASRLH